jgi:uncharacterized protein (TIGR03000 family)
MFSSTRFCGLATGSLALIALLSMQAPIQAQLGSQQGWPITAPRGSSSFPWNSPGYRGYYEPRYVGQPINASAPMAQPQKYELYVNAMPAVKNTDDPNAVTVVAHVPENAQIWIGDKTTTSTGNLRTFQSPPLTPGKDYSYTVRVAWVEYGKLVTETHNFPVKPGDVQCVYLVQAGSKIEGVKDVAATNLAKLSPEDRKLAEAQEYCAVQNGVRLGAMGTPFKTTIQGQPVFLCCESCLSHAQANPARTLAKVNELKTKAKAPASDAGHQHH